MKFLTILFLICSCNAFHLWDENTTKQAIPAKTYVVNLDLPAKERWNDALSHFESDAIKHALHTLMDEYLPSKLLIPIVEMIGVDLERYIPQPFADELRGVAEKLNMNIGDIVLANLVYDISAFNSSGIEACTSIVAMDKNNKIFHGRNLDYAVADLLKPLTLQVDYRRNGETLFMATTYAGYIGVITGTKHGAFSLSGDQRNKGKIWENLLSALEDSWPTFFLERMVLEEAKDYKSAVYHLTKIPTVAPVYYIVGGIRPGEGAIIVKNRWDVLDIKTMGNSWYVLETNYDPWEAPPASDDRRDAGIAAMNRIGKENISPSKLYDALSVPLVFNYKTTYTTVMSAADSSVYHTMIRYDAPSQH